MYGKKKYLRISNRAKLLLQQEEGFDVDFKINTNLSGEDLVAFANSITGGTILLGVDEQTNEDGTQKGKVVGCTVNDQEKMKILNKANQCFPHIDISIHIENANHIPFYRIEIPSSKNKPHCTQKGIYKTRSDGANKPLLPGELLSIYLNKESDNFLKKYTLATKEMRDQLEKQHQTQLKRMWENAFQNSSDLEEIIDRIGGMTDDIQLQLEDSSFDLENLIDQIKEDTLELKNDLEITYNVKHKLNDVDDNVYRLAWKLNSLLEHFDLEDPEITNARNHTKMMLQSSRRSFDTNLGEGKFDKEKVKSFVKDIYEHSNSIIKTNYKVEDLIEWYYGTEFSTK